MGNRAAKSRPVNSSNQEVSTNSEVSEVSINSNSNAETRSSNPSYYTMIKNSYQQLVNAIIRPPRNNYEIDQLGPTEFIFCGKKFHRVDFTLMNERNLCFVCSMWEPVGEDRPNPVLPCVIYMHGNSSSRLEALSTLSVVLSMGATLFAFDFCGSGKSEGDYVSLGAFEKDDLQRVVEYLRCTGTTSTIALWGRSMGAATALLHGERDPSIAAMVLDSAFADLVMLAEEMVEKGRQQGFFAPNLLVRVAINFIRSSVQKQAGFDVKALSPIAHADRCFIPALFVAAEGDNFVVPAHSRKIYEKYGGDKNLILVEGDHNTPRPKYLYDSIAIFLQSTLQIPNEWLMAEGQLYIRRLPWAYRGNQGFSTSHPAALDASVALSLDQLVALSLMEQEVVQGGGGGIGDHGMIHDHGSLADELVMQQGVEDSLYQFLSGGTGSSITNQPVDANNNSITSPPAAAFASSPKSQNLLSSKSNPSRSVSDERSMAPDTRSHSVSVLPPHAIATLEDPTSSPAHSPVSEDDHCWVCDTCTLVNSIELVQCDACGMLRPSLL